MKLIASGLAALALAAVAGSATAATTNIWSTGFDSDVFESTGPFTYSSLTFTYGGGAIVGSEALPGFGSRYYRNSTTGTTSFSATGLGAHSDLHVSFDIAFIDSWDSFGGNCCGPDYLNINIAGASPLVLTWNGGGGSGPVFGPGSVVGTGNFAVSSWSDAVVHYDFIIPHTAASWNMAINFSGAGFQGGDDESWGIDNFSLRATPTGGIPEPATWAMMIAGFGLAGSAIRRRRALTA